MRTALAILVLSLAALGGWPADQPPPASQGRSDYRTVAPLKLAVIGDNGDGSRESYDIARQLTDARRDFPFELVLMLGDNFYGAQTPAEMARKFDTPFAPLLQAGVPFYAALGNHDNESVRFYRPFNMGGERYYTFARRGIRFFVFDTNLLDETQLAWIEQSLAEAREPWKIASFHHPLYSDGDRHGSNVELRVVLEPLLVRHGVSVVFNGHDHIYNRITPQKGITHFVEGSSGKLRKGGIVPTAITAAYFDQDQTFMLAEIEGDELRFRTLSRTGQLVDSGTIRRRSMTEE